MNQSHGNEEDKKKKRSAKRRKNEPRDEIELRRNCDMGVCDFVMFLEFRIFVLKDTSQFWRKGQHWNTKDSPNKEEEKPNNPR